MSLFLYYHPLASFCWKPLIAFYEYDLPFTPVLVDLMDEKSRNEFFKVWPMGQFPVLKDEGRGKTIPQSTPIIEYLTLHFPDGQPLIPADSELALEARRWDGFYDSYLQIPMQKIVGDVLRPEHAKDPTGVSDARRTIATAYSVLETLLEGKTWTLGDYFSLADCAAAPALFYADQVEPLKDTHPNLRKFLTRLISRQSFARVLEEARPFFHMFPYKKQTG